MIKLLVTGGAGFIGSNFVHYMLEKHLDYKIVVVDKLTYAGNLRNLEAVLENPHVKFARLDICDRAVQEAVDGCEMVVNFAAESHVDRSIENAAAFMRTNVEGTWQVLEACRRAKVRRFVQVSTDEVYGSLGPAGKFTEDSPIDPSSPYAASKAAADLVVNSYVRTHKLPAIITRCSNNYGPYQFPEKFIPLMIAQAMSDQKLPVYGDGRNVRDWIHVRDHCAALDVVLHQGREGEVYNIGGNCERQNIDVAKTILRLLGKPESLLEFVIDRPGHDRRYAMDFSKLNRELGWTPEHGFDRGLQETIDWYRENQPWLEETRSGEYRAYFEKHYVKRESTYASKS